MGKLSPSLTTEGSESCSEEDKKGIELRGKSFISAYGRKKDKKLMERLPTMLKGRNESTLIPRLEEGAEEKLLVVFDLDETIVYAREGPLMMRPHAEELLRSLGKKTEVALWTAGVRDYAKAVTVELEKKVWGKSPSGIIQHLISRNDNWFDEEDYTKDLRQLGRDLDSVLIVENTPDCVRLNPKNAIIVEDFEGDKDNVHTLQALKTVIFDLIESKLPVQKFIPSCKMLSKQHIEDVGNVYYLTAGKRNTAKVVKENRDKKKSSKKKEDSPSSSDETEEEPPKKAAKKVGKKAPKKAAKRPAPDSDSSSTEEEPKKRRK
eukprot:TRINITY_DN10404_c0_g1_i1.p1 TRINITY_DN10404_c0_g1~~TRINITY_DN10404_c0_g1_i1.p1  ORF type:complete len:337 (+),score=101.79 TRINITY_DN10404_c0_g1_i1:54-1013(+)